MNVRGRAEGRPRALVVDDSRTTRRLLREFLSRLGFDVAEAENGLLGLDELRTLGSVELIVVDWNMPDMDGLSFIRAVRADDAFEDVRILMVTTEVEMDRVCEALSAGADEYLMKPFSPEMVADKLALLGTRARPA
jgi:two-component system, chemotaxis family, chemotaxis protein CheY